MDQLLQPLKKLGELEQTAGRHGVLVPSSLWRKRYAVIRGVEREKSADLPWKSF